MTLRQLLVIIMLVLSGTARAQTGNYFLSNYTPSDERIDYLTFGMAQDDKGVIYFANKTNVLQFDGRNWTPIPMPGPIYTITCLGSDVYVGGRKGYGKIVWGITNSQVYQSLSQDQTPGSPDIISSLVYGDRVFFLSPHAIFGVSAAGVTDITIRSEGQDSFTGLFEMAGSLYVGSDAHGSLMLDGGKLIPGLFKPADGSFVFSAPLRGTSKVIVGTTANELFMSDTGRPLQRVNVKDAAFLESNVMMNAAWVNPNLLAIGTLRGGVIFINPATGLTEEIVNYQSGLPDNEVYAILKDQNQGVWIAHDYGYTRIAPYLPFRSYSHYPGLSGNLLCARNFNDRTYVGTTLGLFNLVKEEIYEDESYDIQTIKASSRAGFSRSITGFFSMFKKDKKKKKTAAAHPVNKTAHGTRKVLKSLQYSYKKVVGVDGKVSQLNEAHGRLLASGITGVLEVNGLTSKVITTDPVRAVFLSSSLNQLLVSTLNEEVKSYRVTSKGWEETHLLDTLREDVNYIFEDKLQNIWLCGRANVYKIETVDNEITDIGSIPFVNPSLDEPVGVAYGSEVYVAASGNINKFDIRSNEFVAFHSLSGSKKYFASAGYFWFFDGHYWLTVDKEMDSKLQLKWLVLFQNIRFLAPAGHTDGLWVITAGNELYRFSTSKVVTESGKYPLFLREVKSQSGKIAPARIVRVNQTETSVAFDFIQPNYFGNNAIEYHYKVNGISKAWTEYAPSNNIVPFSYLPSGLYKMEIQTRDLLGNESEIQQIQMEVLPPYWKQSWFYALEVGFFGLLVFLSMKLSKAHSRYRVLSDLLSVLTVIMLIQFIQTIAASQISIKSTPVIDFFIQVVIALLVLPLESYLRRLMNRQAKRDAAVISPAK